MFDNRECEQETTEKTVHPKLSGQEDWKYELRNLHEREKTRSHGSVLGWNPVGKKTLGKRETR